MTWKKLPILVFDTETTGLSPTEDRIIELAWTSYLDGRTMGEGSFLFDPGRPLPEFIVNLTGITDADLKGQPAFSEFIEHFNETLSGHALLAGYNAIGFDKHFLTAECVRAGAVGTINQIYSKSWVDPLIWVREFQKFQKGKKLYQAAERLDIFSDDPQHRALSDARVAMRIMAFYMHRMPDDLEEMLALQSQWDQTHNSHYSEWKAKREEITNDT